MVFGPDLVVLEPHENFNVLSLSGKLVVYDGSFFMFTAAAGKPKKENALKTICLFLGPDFITEYITVSIHDIKK